MIVDQITNGPNGTATGPSGSPGSTYDRSSNILAIGGPGGQVNALQMALAVLGPQAPVVTVTTAQTIGSLALPANLQNYPNRTLRVRGFGIYTDAGTASPTITLSLVLGGVTLIKIVSAATSATASANMPFNFSFDMVTTYLGLAATLEAHGWVALNISANTPAAAPATYLDTNVGATATATVGTNPAVGDTFTVNGTLVTFIVNGGTPAGNQVALGTTAAATATAMQVFLAASTDANILKATYTNPSSGVVLATAAATAAVPVIATSVPAKITITSQAVNLEAANTLAIQVAASSAVDSIQLRQMTVEVVS